MNIIDRIAAQRAFVPERFIMPFDIAEQVDPVKVAEALRLEKIERQRLATKAKAAKQSDERKARRKRQKQARRKQR